MAKPIVSDKDVKKSFKQAVNWAEKSRNIADKGGRKGEAGPTSKNAAQEFINKYKDEVKRAQGNLPDRGMSSTPSLEHRGMSSTPSLEHRGMSSTPRVGIGTSPRVGINPNYRAF